MEFKISKQCIRTSDRRQFRRCPRKWSFSSSLKKNLRQKSSAGVIPWFWFGSGIHWAMEDYHGYNKFGDPIKAFKAYIKAHNPNERPDDWQMLARLGIGMLEYYKEWLPKHNIYGFETLWLDEYRNEMEPHAPGARPVVEESFQLQLPVNRYYKKGNIQEELKKVEFNNSYIFVNEDGSVINEEDVDTVPVYYHGTVDRVCIDNQGRWWILDYKTAKAIDDRKLETDDQISAYMWALEQHFQHPIEGFIYLQLRKEVPKEPKRKKDGSLSVAKQQTTHDRLLREIKKDYGALESAPEKLQKLYYNLLGNVEIGTGDQFIQWRLIRRSIGEKISTYQMILNECNVMLDPFQVHWMNPNKDCSWDCEFRQVCIEMTKKNHKVVEDLLSEGFEERPHVEDADAETWISRLKYPGDAGYSEDIGLPKEISQAAIDKAVENVEFKLLSEDE